MSLDLTKLARREWVAVHSLEQPVELGVVPVSPAMLDSSAPVLRSLIDQAMQPDDAEAPEKRLSRHQEQALQAIAIAAVRSIRALGDEGPGIPCKLVIAEGDHKPEEGVFWANYLTTADLATVYGHALTYHGRALQRARGFRARSGDGGDARRNGEEVRDDA